MLNEKGESAVTEYEVIINKEYLSISKPKYLHFYQS